MGRWVVEGWGLLGLLMWVGMQLNISVACDLVKGHVDIIRSVLATFGFRALKGCQG